MRPHHAESAATLAQAAGNHHLLQRLVATTSRHSRRVARVAPMRQMASAAATSLSGSLE